MRVEPLSIEGAFVVTPRQHRDDRGVFLESFRGDVLAEHLGHRPDVVQSNVSVSSRGTVRGIHVSNVPPGQAKYVTALTGSLLDVVVGPIVTASIWVCGPTTCSSAERNSTASRPCVTSTRPIMEAPAGASPVAPHERGPS